MSCSSKAIALFVNYHRHRNRILWSCDHSSSSMHSPGAFVEALLLLETRTPLMPMENTGVRLLDFHCIGSCSVEQLERPWGRTRVDIVTTDSYLKPCPSGHAYCSRLCSSITVNDLEAKDFSRRLAVLLGTSAQPAQALELRWTRTCA